jgi:protein-S-isoprenylcysteine O-methyltransferase Ste14
MERYVILILLWLIWCCLHSFMITPGVTSFIRKHFEKQFPYYRIFYNVVASLTLLPVLAYTFFLNGVPVFQWEGPFRIVQVLLSVSALILFIGGAGRYDLPQFLGLRQARENNTCSVLREDCSLDTKGILGVVRHPWYAGGILIVWARDLDVTAILTNLVISAYFVIGAFLEERKLRTEFGEEYKAYQRNVSMLFPLKWVMRKLRFMQDHDLNA